MVKRPTGGYDGRGVWVAPDRGAAARVLADVGEVLVEPLLRCDHELAVVVARSTTGEVVSYPAVETVQREGQCDEAFVPATTSENLDEAARALASASRERSASSG